ncbi:hypothetical protein EV401DRAFT_2060642 [Pisolithus croceorrhizus]|nr:hypothetical protein EV401DRAFT_2060642 [Pisolithus croceorrhizus]
MVFHPCSNWPLLFQSFEEFHVNAKMFTPPTDNTPYYPFQVAGDFKFMEVALAASLNQAQVDKLLDLISHVAQGMAQVTLKNNTELHKACDATAVQLMPFCKHDVTMLYKKEMLMHEVFTCPLLAPYFVWDAQHVYKYSGKAFEHFYDEPWMADHWWDIQSSLPDVRNAVPFGLIIYANKTKLSSFGTAKGYPVVVWCANLLVEIWNSHVIGGGCVVGWLPIVPEDAQEEGRLGYANLKCMMLLIQGHMCKCPCPVCLVPIDQLHDLTKTYPPHLMDQVQDALSTYCEEWLKALGLWPVEIRDFDPHVALSFDHLHALHDGMGGRHALQVVKRFLIIHHYQLLLYCHSNLTFHFSSISNFPRWHGLSHFKNALNVTFLDGNKKCNLAKEIFYACLDVLTKDKAPEGYCPLHVLASYLGLDSLIGLDVHMEKTIEMIKAELLRFSGALKGYIECVERSGLDGFTHPNESMHGPLKEAYECQSNSRDVASQILCVNEHQLAAKLLRMCIDHHMNWSQVQAQGSDGGLDLEETDGDDPRAFEGHTYLGSPCKLTTMQNIETDHSQTDSAFIREYKYLKVNYESLVNWKLNTNHLQCNPMFHGAPWYDCAVVQLTKADVTFIHLISIFSCEIPDVCSINLALIQPFTAKTGVITAVYLKGCMFSHPSIWALMGLNPCSRTPKECVPHTNAPQLNAFTNIMP